MVSLGCQLAAVQNQLRFQKGGMEGGRSLSVCGAIVGWGPRLNKEGRRRPQAAVLEISLHFKVYGSQHTSCPEI